MKSINKGFKFFFFAIVSLIILGLSRETVTAAMIIAPVNEAHEAVINSNTNMVSYARKHKISKGKWKKTAGGRRYQRKNGLYVKDKWCMIDGAVYCFNKNGYVKTGSFKFKANHYFANANGKVLVKKWYKKGGKIYYYNEKGVRVTGWEFINGKKYYFTRTGELVKNNWVGNQYVGKKGTLVTGKTIQGRKIDKTGVIKNASKKDKFIFVGASHGVDMSVAVNSAETIFIAKGGAGLSWLKKTADPQLRSYLNKNADYDVIFQMGGNDLENVEKYIQYYKKLMKKYPKTRFYFLENIPGDGRKALSYKNAAKRRYDKRLKEAFGDCCIEAYEYMETIGFETVDGTHYTLRDIKKVYEHAIRMIKKRSKK